MPGDPNASEPSSVYGAIYAALDPPSSQHAPIDVSVDTYRVCDALGLPPGMSLAQLRYLLLVDQVEPSPEPTVASGPWTQLLTGAPTGDYDPQRPLPWPGGVHEMWPASNPHVDLIARVAALEATKDAHVTLIRSLTDRVIDIERHDRHHTERYDELLARLDALERLVKQLDSMFSVVDERGVSLMERLNRVEAFMNSIAVVQP
jgi:hypothetical protein